MWGSEKQDIMDNFLKCPFCLSQSVEAKSGKSNCPVCFGNLRLMTGWNVFLLIR